METTKGASLGNITGWHVHLYFDETTVDKAREIAERVTEKFDLHMGTVHERLVGPHPRFSVMLSFDKGKFGRVIPWVMKNRDGLTVFTHPETGDDLKDHTDHALWMGEMLELDLSIFNQRS